jgi:hypothetical protein
VAGFQADVGNLQGSVVRERTLILVPWYLKPIFCTGSEIVYQRPITSDREFTSSQATTKKLFVLLC